MEVYGRENIGEIAQKISLPEWWVESVIVEYFDCRRFGEQEEIWTFDFTKLDEEIAEMIIEKKVIISHFYLVQNIRSADLSMRTLNTMIGLPVITLEDADLIPEGLVNRTGFPSPIYNDISVYDRKLEFFTHAIVFDNGIFYQWKIADFYPIPGKHYGWFKSDLFDLEPLFEINRKLQGFRNSEEIKKPTQEFRMKIKEAYDELEKIKEPIRQKILEYHQKKKTEFNPDDANVPDPPLLSYFESIKPAQNGYYIKTHMEPLFLRSAIRHYNKAKEARSKLFSNPKRIDYDALLDEIENSAMCIISATNCLEAYINYVIKKYLPKESKIFDDTSSHRQKWLWVPTALNLPKKFVPEEKPFSDFSNLIRWRNNAIHYMPEYRRARGSVSQVINQFNLENAELSIRIIKDMVRMLSEDSNIPLPRWIATNMGSAQYWDEVLNYLKQLENEKEPS